MSGTFGQSVTSSTYTASLVRKLSATATVTSQNTFLPHRDILSFPLRALHHIETFAFSTVPRQVGRLAGIDDMSLNLWPVTTSAEVVLENDVPAVVQAAADMAGEGVTQAVAQGDSWYFTELVHTMHKVGGFFGYLTSIWSFACLAEALILNRITIYASTRRHLRLGWERRLALRIIPIMLFGYQLLSLLRAIKCQTSPDYSSMRYGKPGKAMAFDYAGSGGSLYSLTSTLLPWESDLQACSAVKMGLAGSSTIAPHGSFSFLWPIFVMFCIGHFVETLSCALQGRPVMTETGMSIFELSLAFSEAENMIGRSIGLGLFGLPKKSPLDDASPGDTSTLALLTRTQILNQMNVTPELLLIVLISCCNNLTSHILDVFGKQSRYRLFNTALWGACFMAAMSWGLENGSPISLETGVLRFPTVCVVGFIPHLLVFIGIIICLAIYGLALTITAFSLSPENGSSISLRQRFTMAHENMQGSNQIRSIRFNRHEDFYTTLLRIGYVALTAASEAVFLNEGKAVIARQMTWLEQDRIAEIEASRKRNSSGSNWANLADTTSFETAALSSFDLSDQLGEWESGYSKEKKIEKPKNGARSMRSQGGVGAARASIRMLHGLTYFRSIFSLIARWIACGFSLILDRMGIKARPQWLKRLSGSSEDRPSGNTSSPGYLDFWILTDEGELELPENHDFDLEVEMRKRERYSRQESEGPDEQRRFDERLYGWWKVGGSWGNQDHTPDYIPSVEDDDMTSVVSMSTNVSQSDWEDYASEGRLTPTRANPFPNDRDSSPMHENFMDISTLARLLDPRDRETREEARILAAHLNSDLNSREGSGRILTRSRYQQQVERERSRVLLSSRLHRHAATGSDPKRRPSPEEEAELLEKLILSHRSVPLPNSDSSTWESGATGLGPNGPPCVVCQTSPRSIITWPCRCLCICEECRVSLAMNNFGSCVTCRQEVGGFMRLWVP